MATAAQVILEKKGEKIFCALGSEKGFSQIHSETERKEDDLGRHGVYQGGLDSSDCSEHDAIRICTVMR